MEQVTQALGTEPLLLILDNFEQLAEEGAPIVWMLLDQIPASKKERGQDKEKKKRQQ